MVLAMVLNIASWCCANSLPCSCGGRIYNKMYTCCDKCLARKEKERWEKKELKEWDGETPIYSHAIDKYFFFDFEEIEDVAYEENLTLEEMKLVLCQPARKPVFDIANILNDYLVEDYDPDDIPEINKVEKTVQNWIDEHVPTMWEPSKYRVDLTKMEK